MKYKVISSKQKIEAILVNEAIKISKILFPFRLRIIVNPIIN